jgi:argininosuccinate lyase
VEELWRTFDDARGALTLFSAVLDSLTIHEGAALAAFEGSWCWTSDLAAALVLEHALPWRTAQQSVSVLVRQMIDARRSAESVTEADVARAYETYTGQRDLDLATGFVHRVRDPQAIVESRIVPGGPARADVLAQAQAAAAVLDRDTRIVLEFDAVAEAADSRLGEAVQALLGVPL